MRRTGLAVAMVVMAWGAPGLAQDNTAFAQQRFARGTTFYDAHDYVHALEEFRASLGLYSSPNARLYVARCLRETGRLDEALPEFERTVREAADRAQTDPRYAATRDAGQAELLSLAPRVGRLTLSVTDIPPGTHVQVAGRDLPLAALGVGIPVLPGTVAVLVEAEGYLPDHRDVSVTAGQETAVTVQLQHRPVLQGHTETPWQPVVQHPVGPVEHPARGVPRAAAWAGFIVGGVGLVGFGAFALAASGRYNDLQTACGMTTCPSARSGDVSGGRTFQTLTNVSLGVGVAGLAAGGIFWLLGHPAYTETPAAPVRVGFAGTSVTVDGVF